MAVGSCFEWLISGYCGNFVTCTFIDYNLTHIRHFNKTTDVCYEYKSFSCDSEKSLHSETVYEKLKTERYFKFFRNNLI